MIDNLINAALVFAVPLVLAALGGAVQRRSGVVNIGLEGQMLIGALFGAILSGLTGNWLAGAAAGALAGALVGWLMTAVITRLSANPIIVGLGLNIVVFGLVGYVLRTVFEVSGTLRIPGLQKLPELTIPGIADVPFLGAVLSGKDPLFWLAVVLVPVLAWTFRNTSWGIRLRASGASPASTTSLGIRTNSVRDSAGIVAGALAGLGGVALSLGAVGLFNENMTAGRGYVALAAFYFGRSHPLPTALACLLFGFFDALQIRLQTGGGVSADLIQTIPYIAVVLVLAVTGFRRSRRSSRVAV
jgi:simple sugar transport system permease protein